MQKEELKKRLLESALPLSSELENIANGLAHSKNAILTAAPGSGKTCLMPSYLALQDYLEDTALIVLEQRRSACVQAEYYVSRLLGLQSGEFSGFQVKDESALSKTTRVIYMTEALFLRRLQHDSELKGIGAVIFDEFHERTLISDLLLALLLDARTLNPSLRLVLMSATLEIAPIKAFLDRVESKIDAESPESAEALNPSTKVFSSGGRNFPVKIEYAPCGDLFNLTKSSYQAALANATISPAARAQEAFTSLILSQARRTKGDTLVFLPGYKELENTRQSLREKKTEFDIRLLYGSQSLDEQRIVLNRKDLRPLERRIVLATAVAEASLTIPEIDLVIDSGLQRLVRYDQKSEMNRLVTEMESRFQSDQRSGRAGRVRSGLSIRAFKEDELTRDTTECEILRSELSSLVLECALWGIKKPSALSWLTEPKESAWNSALSLLQDLKLLDTELRPCKGIEKILEYGMGSHLGLILWNAEKKKNDADGASIVSTALALCAILQAEIDLRPYGGDVSLCVEALSKRELDYESAFKFKREIKSIASRANLNYTEAALKSSICGELLSAAFVQGLGKLKADKDYVFMSGRMARVKTSNPVNHEYILALVLDSGLTSGTVYTYVPIKKEEVYEYFAFFIKTNNSISFEESRYKVQKEKSLASIVLHVDRNSSSHSADLDPTELKEAFANVIKKEKKAALPWSEKVEVFYARLKRFCTVTKKDDLLQSLSLDTIFDTCETWLFPCIDFNKNPLCTEALLISALEGFLSYAEKSTFKARYPPSIVLPSGETVTIEYTGQHAPSVTVKMQAVYGIQNEILIAGEALTFILLSPSAKPLQITSNLGLYWLGSYQETRKEMRSRYPKHFWPENPGIEKPILKGKSIKK